MQSVARFATSEDLVRGVADGLVARLLAWQGDDPEVVHLCLTGGRIANQMYEAFSERVADSPLDLERLEFWWGDERFVPTDDPSRHAGHTLAILARTIPLSSARTHPMGSADGITDAAAAASNYARELGETVFDLCLLGVGEDGHVASLFPGHPSFTETHNQTVIGVTDAPLAPAERISLTAQALGRSREVWFVVSGADKAEAVGKAHAGDPTLPAGVVRGREATRWFVDEAAGREIPYHSCRF